MTLNVFLFLVLEEWEKDANVQPKHLALKALQSVTKHLLRLFWEWSHVQTLTLSWRTRCRLISWRRRTRNSWNVTMILRKIPYIMSQSETSNHTNPIWYCFEMHSWWRKNRTNQMTCLQFFLNKMRSCIQIMNKYENYICISFQNGWFTSNNLYLDYNNKWLIYTQENLIKLLHTRK
jgi:hypothetical protein